MVINETYSNGVTSDRGSPVEYRMGSPAPFSGVPAGAPQMDDRTRGGMQNLSGGLGNMVPESGAESKLSEAEAAERDRARRANKIYKQVCNDRGMTLCFFNNFGTWSDFVNGRISDSEFYEQSESAARKMAGDVNEH